MAKSNVKTKPISQDEYVTNKVLSVFTVCLLGVLLLMVLQRLMGYGNTWAVGALLCKVLIGVGALGVLWSLWLFAKERSGKRQSARRIVCGRNVLIVSVVSVLILSVINYLGVAPIKAFYVILPALAVYYLIFHSYAPEFFLISVDCGLAAALIMVIRRAQASSSFAALAYIALAVMAVVAVVEIAAVYSLRAKKGVLAVGKRKFSFALSKNAYVMLTLTPLVMLALVAAAVVLGSSAHLICMGIAAAFLFVTAVYYTVKLM